MENTSPDHSLSVGVSFGDCDPAGIVFYPNFFRWFDRCFHHFLAARAGGHAELCARLGALGVGLMDVQAQFRAPVRENCTLTLDLRVLEWRGRALRLGYEGHVGGTVCVTGQEVRGLFVMREGRMTAGEMAPLRAALGL